MLDNIGVILGYILRFGGYVLFLLCVADVWRSIRRDKAKAEEIKMKDIISEYYIKALSVVKPRKHGWADDLVHLQRVLYIYSTKMIFHATVKEKPLVESILKFNFIAELDKEAPDLGKSVSSWLVSLSSYLCYCIIPGDIGTITKDEINNQELQEILKAVERFLEMQNQKPKAANTDSGGTVH
jgi:hypothetical protein